MTAVLTVPKPTLRYTDGGGGAAALEQPVTVLLGAVLRDGSAVAPAALSAFGYVAMRRSAPGALLEQWDDAGKSWVPDPGPATAPVKATQLAYKAGDPNPWQGMLVAAGGQDSQGKPQYVKAQGGYPLYSVRAWFAPSGGAIGAASPLSDNLAFVSASDRNLMVVGPGPDEKPDQATQARVLLKDTGLVTIGGLTIQRDAPGAVVTLDNAAGASVVLHADGSIELRPATGRGVLVAGDVETEHITYRPFGGGAKQTLA